MKSPNVPEARSAKRNEAEQPPEAALSAEAKPIEAARSEEGVRGQCPRARGLGDEIPQRSRSAKRQKETKPNSRRRRRFRPKQSCLKLREAKQSQGARDGSPIVLSRSPRRACFTEI